MNYRSNPEIYQQIAPKAFNIRGWMINETIVVERLMDRIIANHFSSDPDKQIELLQLIVSTKRINFESKRQILKHLLEMHFKDRLSNERITLLVSDLKKLEDHRNIFAHYILDTGEGSIERLKAAEIGFIKILNTASIISYNEDELREVKSLIVNCQTTLFELYGHVSPAP